MTSLVTDLYAAPTAQRGGNRSVVATSTMAPAAQPDTSADSNLGVLPSAVDPLALSLNENPFPPLPGVRLAIDESIGVANRYPEFLPERLRRVVAAHVGVDYRQVVLGAGATGVMYDTLHALTDPGDRVAWATPAFDGYSIVVRMARLIPVTVPLDGRGHHDLNALADAASDAKVVVISRPHNPTGTVESVAAVEAFLRRVSADTIVILDEAYVEFVAPQYRIDAVDLIRRFPNVVVLRTFSKAYGLAGLRIGYGFGSPEMAAQLWAMQLPFGMGIHCLAAVTASYGAEAQLRNRIRLITSERRKLCMRLRSMGVDSTDGHANFIYLPAAGRPWREVFDNSGVQVRHYADGGVRITVGARSSTCAVLAAVKSRP